MNLLGLYLSIASSQAAEVFWDGMYRVRGQYFDTLSLSDTNTLSEGSSNALNQRLLLIPHWRISSALSVHSQLDLLSYAPFGSEGTNYSNPTNNLGLSLLPDTVSSNNSLQVTRLWAEIQSNYGLFKLGRIPLHWGSGMVFHAGNDPWSEFGNSVDRIQYSQKVQNLFLLAAVESYNENDFNRADDTWGLAGSIYYASARTHIGLYTNYRNRGSEGSNFGMLTADISASLKSGDLDADLEIALNYGNGDIEGGLENINVLAFGATANVGLQISKLRLGLGGGFAQGDANPDDETINTFSFNRDYNLALMMFEEPMPILQSATSDETSSVDSGREFGAVRSGYSVSNAIYVRPALRYNLHKSLQGELVVLTAWTAALPEDELNGFYGVEVDAHLYWTPFAQLQFDASLGFFSPGNYYSQYTSTEYGGGFNRNAFAGQLITTLEF
ncbi:MAG: hypothetical protein VX278_18185 [Myxococcota bacterium]|nr:hypothetical protein [Myxococcota bacterium]